MLNRKEGVFQTSVEKITYSKPTSGSASYRINVEENSGVFENVEKENLGKKI